LKHLASIANPEFFRRQASRISTFGVPRYVTCFEDEGGELRIPRGLEEEARQILEAAGFTVTISRPRRKRPRIDVTFTGTLPICRCPSS
ncbi:MAG: helicase, partial [Actinomycetales bacterium]|nr:helicase [Actinomycetales bacterium]